MHHLARVVVSCTTRHTCLYQRGKEEWESKKGCILVLHSKYKNINLESKASRNFFELQCLAKMLKSPASTSAMNRKTEIILPRGQWGDLPRGSHKEPWVSCYCAAQPWTWCQAGSMALVSFPSKTAKWLLLEAIDPKMGTPLLIECLALKAPPLLP